MQNFFKKDIYTGNGPDGPIYETVIRPLELLSGSVGYRRQAPNSHFVFRAGIGWPEALYVGWGYAF